MITTPTTSEFVTCGLVIERPTLPVCALRRAVALPAGYAGER